MTKERSKGFTPSANKLIRENERLRIELHNIRRSRLASNISSAWRETVKWLSIGYFGVGVVQAVAGKATLVDAKLNLSLPVADLVKELAPHWAVPVVCLFVTFLALASNARYRRVNAQLVKRVGVTTEKYEIGFDPMRSSSGLGSDGQTHERDAI